MKDEVKNKLKEALTQTGLTDILQLLDLDDETTVEDKVKELKANLNPKFTELLQKQKEYQSEFDRLLKKAVDTREENLKKEFNFIKKEDGKKPEEGKDEKDPMTKEFEELKKLVMEQRQQLTLEKRQAEAANLLKQNKIPDYFIKGFDFNSADKTVSEQFETVKTEFEQLKTEITAGAGVLQFPVPGGLENKPTDKELNDIVNSL